MELAEGGDLLKLTREHKKSKSMIPEDEIWRIAHQITIGLKGLHDRNILHRDLKSANVFLALDRTVKLGDLNIAKLTENSLAHTQTGTPYYTSPEIWNNRPYCSKCDIWSLGCVLYELAALDTPFKGADMAQLYRRITSGVIADIPHAYSRDLMAFIRTLLKINPDARPTCEQILNRYFTSASRSILRDNTSLPMLGTIKLTNNLNYLRARLPGPNYIDHRPSTPPASSKKLTECRNNCEDHGKPGIRNKSARTQTIIRERRANRFKTAERVILNCHHRPDLR
jgi:NIMA (never in mitosis gene a)-related kinase